MNVRLNDREKKKREALATTGSSPTVLLANGRGVRQGGEIPGSILSADSAYMASCFPFG